MSVTRVEAVNGKDEPIMLTYDNRRALFLNGFLILSTAAYGTDLFPTVHTTALSISNAVGKKVRHYEIDSSNGYMGRWSDIYEIIRKGEEKDHGLSYRVELI